MVRYSDMRSEARRQKDRPYGVSRLPAIYWAGCCSWISMPESSRMSTRCFADVARHELRGLLLLPRRLPRADYSHARRTVHTIFLFFLLSSMNAADVHRPAEGAIALRHLLFLSTSNRYAYHYMDAAPLPRSCRIPGGAPYAHDAQAQLMMFPDAQHWRHRDKEHFDDAATSRRRRRRKQALPR